MKEKRTEKRRKEPKKKSTVAKQPKRAKTSQIVAYSESSSSSSSSSEEEEEESEEEEEEVTKDAKIMNVRLAKVNDNMKAQPDYETLYNGKLLRSHWTNIQKVSFLRKNSFFNLI